MKNLLFWSVLFIITMFFACNSENTHTAQAKSSAERKMPEPKIVQETTQPSTATIADPTPKAVEQNLESKTQKRNPSASPQATKQASRQVVKENTPDPKITMNKEQGRTGAAIPVTITAAIVLRVAAFLGALI